ncbi:MAG: helical backbone metal receptor [Deltaproteobacteria bacterium]|nr:helical backbone metal receptor [Deltaproteobacteria bacterium]
MKFSVPHFLYVVVATAIMATACQNRSLPTGSDSAVDRLITLAPSVTEIAFAVGLGDRVVGVGDYCQWPPEARTKPRLGGLFNPNLEGIVDLQPQLAVLLPSENELGRQLGRLGVEVLTVRSETLLDLEETIIALSRRCGVEARGQQLVERLRKNLAPRPIAEGHTVLISVGRAPGSPSEVRVAGPGTYLDQLVTRLGATNVFADLETTYPLVNLEVILARSPDFIFELSAVELTTEAKQAFRQDWLAFPQIKAAEQGQVHIFDGDFTVVPGPRLPALYDAMASALQTSPTRSAPDATRQTSP